jgi:hypothetical protein
MKTPTSHPLYKLRSQPTVLCLNEQRSKNCEIRHATEDRVSLVNDKLIYERKWLERRGIVFQDTFYFWEKEKSLHGVPYSTKTFFQIDNQTARVTNVRKEDCFFWNRPEIKNAQFEVVSLFVINQTGKILLEHTNSGLFDVPCYYQNWGATPDPTPLLDRAFTNWQKLKVEGPYVTGHIHYYVMKWNGQSSIKLNFYDHDIAQQNYRVTIVMMDLITQPRDVSSVYRTDNVSSQVITSSADLGPDLINRMAISFNVQFEKVGGWYLFETKKDRFNALALESMHVGNEKLLKKLDRKVRRKRERGVRVSGQDYVRISDGDLDMYGVFSVYQLLPGEKRFEFNKIIVKEKELTKRLWIPLSGFGVIFPTLESERENTAFISALVYFYLGPKVQHFG